MKRIATSLTLAALLLLSAATLAGDSYAVPWAAVPGGGGASAGGGYALANSIGQPAVGQAAAGAFSLASGFYAGVPGRSLYLPLLLHNG